MKVQLSLHARDLKNVEGGLSGTSDPFAVVTILSPESGSKAEVLGKTEVARDTLNPDWLKVFVFEYELGAEKRLTVSLYDENKGENTSMGSIVFDVGRILGIRGNSMGKKIRNDRGTLYASIRKSTGTGTLNFHIEGINLTNKEGFGIFQKSDPFFELCCKSESQGMPLWDKVYRSEFKKNDLSPKWKNASVQLSVLCAGDFDAPIQIAIYDHEGSGNHVPMGQVETTVNELVQISSGESSEPHLVLTDKGKESGKIAVLRADVSVEGIDDPIEEDEDSQEDTTTKFSALAVCSKPNFLDYVSGGCQINVVVAIDFTGSNGNPMEPGTLHHISDDDDNDYEKAMAAIVKVLSKYDSDQKYPVFGFGAKYDGEINHCFVCGEQDEHDGIDGVLDAYRQVFKSGLVMSRPTVFTEVIETAAARARSQLEAALESESQAYTILLILSDGSVSDVDATKECLAKVSDAPLSIVIVGLGDADFHDMQFLDDCASEEGQRDMAQFVQFNQHCESSVQLTSETLKEIPQQLVNYFQGKEIPPMDARRIEDEGEIIVEPEEEEEIDLSLDIGEEEIVVSAGGAYNPSWK